MITQLNSLCIFKTLLSILQECKQTLQSGILFFFCESFQHPRGASRRKVETWFGFQLFRAHFTQRCFLKEFWRVPRRAGWSFNVCHFFERKIREEKKCRMNPLTRFLCLVLGWMPRNKKSRLHLGSWVSTHEGKGRERWFLCVLFSLLCAISTPLFYWCESPHINTKPFPLLSSSIFIYYILNDSPSTPSWYDEKGI